MARIGGKDTKPELMLRRALWGIGLRYRVHYKTRAGRIDIAFPGRKVAIFVDGCFWHKCSIHFVEPASRNEFWSDKIQENVKRDRRQNAYLAELGWTVMRFWEHEIYNDLDSIKHKINATLLNAPKPR